MWPINRRQIGNLRLETIDVEKWATMTAIDLKAMGTILWYWSP
jgi:hypothetical protein